MKTLCAIAAALLLALYAWTAWRALHPTPGATYCAWFDLHAAGCAAARPAPATTAPLPHY